MTNILLAILLTSAARPFEAHTLDGRTLTGLLVELSADRATILTAQGRVSLEADKLLTISQKQKGDEMNGKSYTGTPRVQLAELVEEKVKELLSANSGLSQLAAHRRANDLVVKENPDLLAAYRQDTRSA